MNYAAIGPLAISLSALELTDKERELLAHPKVGALVLFKENYDVEGEDPKTRLKALISDVRSIRPNILIFVDHEGGNVWRFEKGFTKLPAAKAYGDIFMDKGLDPAKAYAFERGRICAQELLQCDIDVSFGPVVDLDGLSPVIGKRGRAFHSDPEVVFELARAFIRGMNEAGMPAVLKHFPGHGSCLKDSHQEVPVDDREIDELQDDLKPFVKLSKDKSLNLAIMSNHVLYPEVDAEFTAGYSPIWLKGALRVGFGYQGLIISDCLAMGGANIGGPLTRIKQASKAGHDLIIVSHQHNSPGMPLLDNLLAILDEVPDNTHSQARRNAFADNLRHGKRTEIITQYLTRSKEKPLTQISPKSVVDLEPAKYNTHKGIA